jgi:hypothetical protein
MTALCISRMFRAGRALVTAGALGVAALAVGGCAVPVGSDDDGSTANPLTGGSEEAQMGANPDSSGGTDGRPRNPAPTRMADNHPGDEPDPSPWARDDLQVGVVVTPPGSPSPSDEPDPSPWMHKLDTSSR